MGAQYTDLAVPDVQGYADARQIAINKVGIKDIRHPVRILDRNGCVQHTVATFNMNVALPHHFKGTHMSRFIEILNRQTEEISVQNFEEMLREMVKRLEAESGHIEMNFRYFLLKSAPVSGVTSLLDYEVSLMGEINSTGQFIQKMKVIVPVTSLCPCSKKISERGAHNQRSTITMLVSSSEPIWIDDLVRIAEDQASCELYSLLKRPDEKFVTEKAYDNPKFVEDIVRDVAQALATDCRITTYVVEVENFESIHNHSAYAQITSTKNRNF
ncbi:MAG: putative cyclohydrolase [Firmicutes bacterium]|nr:putative cyclohydrolase [Bacillota bacterium]